MSRLFRLKDTVRTDPAIEFWFQARDPVLVGLARPWFDAMRACGDDVRECMHDDYPTACVGDAAFAYVGVFKAHVNVGLFPGAELDDPSGLLEGTGKFMRHVKLRPGRPVDESALHALIAEACAHVRKQLHAASG